MAELPALVKDLALILIVAGGVTLLFKRLRQPLVLGYIVAGFLVSPHMPYTMSVIDKADVQMWADIGVIFLLFSLGLDFSFKKILKMGMAPMIAAITIILCMMFAGTVVGHLFGWAAYSLAACLPCRPPPSSTRLSTIWGSGSRSLPGW